MKSPPLLQGQEIPLGSVGDVDKCVPSPCTVNRDGFIGTVWRYNRISEQTIATLGRRVCMHVAILHAGHVYSLHTTHHTVLPSLIVWLTCALITLRRCLDASACLPHQCLYSYVFFLCITVWPTSLLLATNVGERIFYAHPTGL